MKEVEVATLRLFVAVAECGSLSLARERVHLVVPAISRRINDLERQLGEVLFTRHARGVRLTAAGEAVMRHARAVLDQLDQMRADVSEYSQGAQGLVRLTGNTSAITQFLPDELARFLAAYPGVAVALKEKISSKTISAILKGQVDLGIFMASEPHEDVVSWPYRRDHLGVVMPPGHPLAQGRPLSFDEVLEHDFVGLKPGSALVRLLRRHASGRMRLRVQVRSFDAMCRMVQAGLGIGILPQGVAGMHVASMNLRSAPLSDPWAVREMRIGTRSPDTLTVPARNLLRHLTGAHGPATVPEPAGRSPSGRSRPAAKAAGVALVEEGG